MKLPVTKTTVQVRFSDTDAFGHVSSGSYFQYMEIGRTDFFYELGKVSEVPNNVVVNINIDYVSETLFGEEVTVVSRCSKVGTKSLNISNEVYAGERLVVKGTVTLVGFDLETRQSCKLPAEWEPSEDSPI
jgi:acyl-CoA thioester hydrolase